MGNYGKTKQTTQRQCAKDWNLEITKLWVAHTLAKEESQKNLYCSPEWKKNKEITPRDQIQPTACFLKPQN